MRSRSREKMRFFRALLEGQQHVCPIALLLVYTLRHGLVVGSTIDEVLHIAVTRPDRKVQWVSPKYPVLAAFNIGGASGINITKPAITDQIRQTLNPLGVVSNILCRIHPHALRSRHSSLELGQRGRRTSYK